MDYELCVVTNANWCYFWQRSMIQDHLLHLKLQKKIQQFFYKILVDLSLNFKISCFQAKSQFKRRSTANNVEIVIPVPPDADSPKFKTTVGSCKYAPEQNAVIWSIKSFPVSFIFYLSHNDDYLKQKSTCIVIIVRTRCGKTWEYWSGNNVCLPYNFL